MKVREATLEDHGAITAVRRRNGLDGEDYKEWKRRWMDNPFRAAQPDAPMGWVFEEGNGRLVGMFGNIPLAYEWNGQRLRTAAASGWAVDKEFRSFSLLLAAMFFRQKNVDLLLNTTANLEAGRVFAAFGAERVPHPAYDEVLLWITNYPGFAASVLRHKAVPGASELKYPAALALWALDALKRRNRRRRAYASVRWVPDFDERFDAFWLRLRQRPGRLLAVRDRAALAWHFRSACLRGAVEILVLEEQSELSGYLVLVRRDREDIGLRRLLVADLQVLGETPGRVQALMAGALRVARERDIHLVEVVGFEAFKRRPLEQLVPHRRKLPVWPFFCKVLRPALRPVLTQAGSWDPSPFDGDASL